MVMKLTRRKTIFVACAIFLGCLVTILPRFLYPAPIIKMETGVLPKSMYPYESQVPELEYREFWALREKYSLENNLIQMFATLISAMVVGIAVWLYSKRII